MLRTYLYICLFSICLVSIMLLSNNFYVNGADEGKGRYVEKDTENI